MADSDTMMVLCTALYRTRTSCYWEGSIKAQSLTEININGGLIGRNLVKSRAEEGHVRAWAH